MSNAKQTKTDFSASVENFRAASADAAARADAAADPVEASLWRTQVRHLDALAGLHDELGKRSQPKDEEEKQEGEPPEQK